MFLQSTSNQSLCLTSCPGHKDPYHCQVCLNTDCNIYQSLPSTAGSVKRWESNMYRVLFTSGTFCILVSWEVQWRMDTTTIHMCVLILTKYVLGCHLDYCHSPQQDICFMTIVTLSWDCLCSHSPKLSLLKILFSFTKKLHHYDKDKFIFWWEKCHSFTGSVRQLL
jgi:hypothetical protein